MFYLLQQLEKTMAERALIDAASETATAVPGPYVFWLLRNHVSTFDTGFFPQDRKRYREDATELLTALRVMLKVSTHFSM